MTQADGVNAFEVSITQLLCCSSSLWVFLIRSILDECLHYLMLYPKQLLDVRSLKHKQFRLRRGRQAY